MYQQIHFDTEYSCSVVLQMAKPVRKHLDRIIAEHAPGYFGQGYQIMQFHLLILLSTADNWGEYIEYLHCMVKNVVRELFNEVLLCG